MFVTLGKRLLLLVCMAAAWASGETSAFGQSGLDLTADPLFRVERLPIAAGGELLTVFGRPDPGVSRDVNDAQEPVPLVSVLRDTLGDDDPENDRLRYVWVHGYATPSAAQRIASAIPFLNRRTSNKPLPTEPSMPPSVIDLGAPARELWRHVLWTVAEYTIFDYGVIVKTSVRAFKRNDEDYRKAHVIRALAVLALVESERTRTKAVLSPNEIRDIQSRLVLAQSTIGGVINDGYLTRVHERQTTNSEDVRGHNWELLRQRVEAEHLYFDPLTMPDGSTTHVLVWAARDDVATRREFNSRFLNIKSPWGDKRLVEWKGVTETRYFDSNNVQVSADAPGARAVELIPVALYGLDHPKIPALLIDFRSTSNPKRREVSRRLVNDITRGVLELSPYGDLQYLVGRSVYNFVTGRRGMDINQPSRLRSYSQLKLLLTLNESIDPELASEASRLIEHVSMNPLQNDLEVERALAEQSYARLREAAQEEDRGLSSLIERDRRREFVRAEHSVPARILLYSATVATAGIYRHRESQSPAEQKDGIDVSRRLAYHRRYLKETLASTPIVEVTASLDDVQRSLRYLMDKGSRRDGRMVKLAARLFDQTDDPTTRRLSLDCLAYAGTDAARRELMAIYEDNKLGSEWRLAALQVLGGPGAPGIGAAAGAVTAGASAIVGVGAGN
jgi:hypothetical protein